MVVKNFLVLSIAPPSRPIVCSNLYSEADRQHDPVIKPPLIRYRVVDFKTGITVPEVSEVSEERFDAVLL